MKSRAFWIGTVVLGLVLVGVVSFAQLRRGELAQAELSVAQLTCGSCARSVQQALQELPGVGKVEVNVTAGRASVEFDPQRVEPLALADRVTAAGYPAQVKQVLSVAEVKALRNETGSLGESYVARIGDQLVSREEFIAEVTRVRGGAQAAGQPIDELQIQRTAWQQILQHALVMADAARAGVVVQPAEVAAEVERMGQGNSEFAATMSARFGGEENFFRLVRDEMTIQRHLQENVLPAETDPAGRQAAVDRWYRELTQSRPVSIFDPALKAAVQNSGGCSCCG
ncbi:MAG: cation transporter [Desulfuromonadales bacterium]|nr:cation transporter [Desulfuromonadales bacterium]